MHSRWFKKVIPSSGKGSKKGRLSAILLLAPYISKRLETVKSKNAFMCYCYNFFKLFVFKKKKNSGGAYGKQFVLTDVSTTVFLAFEHIFPSFKS